MNEATFQVLPRTVRRETPLAPAVIVYPGVDPVYRQMAEALAQAIARVSGVAPELHADADLMPSRSTPLPDRFRTQTVILLGSINTNRALLPLYARYLCATDATYPGGDGCDLRTVVNAYGTGTNVILAGGSSARGVERAVERLIEQIAGDTLPFLLEVELESSLAQALADWPDAPLHATVADGLRKTHAFNEDLMKLIGAYGIMYAWTGDRRYGEIARDGLKAVNAQMDDSYGDWHYRAERMLRAIPWLIAGGFLDAADILRTDQLLLATALGTQEMWWRMRDGHPPLGHRHQGRGTFEFLLLARYLKEQAHPSDALRDQCDRWIAESSAYLDGLGSAGIDDQDDESTLTNLATVFWYALGEERYDFFERGSARRVALRALALHDNMGAGAGQGGYGEGFPGTMILQQEATVPIAASALYFQDGGLKWVLEHLPHLKAPLISGFLHFSPLFLHLFHTGLELATTPPQDLVGLHVLPITPHQHAISTNPPEHVEYAGHSVNAPETWRRGEGIGLNTLAPEQGFDKIVLRGGFAPGDAYLLLQGYQGGFRWQGHMQAANCIVRFSQAGHIFLIQNTNRHSHYQKNGLFISDGYNDTPIRPIAERISAADFAHVALSATRLSDFHHADWTRHIFWSKHGDGLFVVIDSAAFQSDGSYALTCTWRTPAFARLKGRSWETRQGEHQFTLISSEPLDATSEEEKNQGGAVPFVLRQRKYGEFAAGETVSFQNLFYLRSVGEAAALDLRKLDAGQVFVTRDGQPLAWCGIADADGEIRALGLTLRAVNAWVSRDEMAVSGLTHLTFAGADIAFDQPISLVLDFASGQVSSVPAGSIDLPAEIWRELADTLRDELSRLQAAPDEPTPSADETETPLWTPDWSFDNGTRLPRRIRDLTVQAVPPPLDGFAEQVADGVVAEIRQTRQQWPQAEQYEITLTLADEQPIDHLRIIGDSKIDPTLRTFHPLPDGITVKVSGEGGQQDCPLEAESGVLRYKLYRDIEDRLETRSARIGAKARQIRVLVRAPAPGNPLVLHEIEVYGCEQDAPPVQMLKAADSGGSDQQILVVNAANELIALSQDGKECWRKRFDAPVTHLSTHDLRGGGQPSVCVGVLGGDLHIFSADGTPERVLPMPSMFQSQRDAYFGRVYTIHDVQVWARDAEGRAALVVGGYSAICFLDANFEIVGHSWADGSWQSSILVAPDSGDLWVRNGWNHGIGRYEGKAGFAPSGETIPFGGVNQPMFRGLRKVIPFVNGATVAYEWIGSDILAAAENGVGVLSTERGDWRWSIEGGTPISACIAAGDTVIVGGADGFIAAFGQADGRPLRNLYNGAPVTGLAVLGDQLAVATRRGLLLLDRDWRIMRTYPQPVSHLLRLSPDTLVIAREDGALELLRNDS